MMLHCIYTNGSTRRNNVTVILFTRGGGFIYRRGTQERAPLSHPSLPISAIRGLALKFHPW